MIYVLRICISLPGKEAALQTETGKLAQEQPAVFITTVQDDKLSLTASHRNRSLQVWQTTCMHTVNDTVQRSFQETDKHAVTVGSSSFATALQIHL